MGANSSLRAAGAGIMARSGASHYPEGFGATAITQGGATYITEVPVGEATRQQLLTQLEQQRPQTDESDRGNQDNQIFHV